MTGVPAPLEPIEVGSCPRCGGPAQFLDGGQVRHVPVVNPVDGRQLADLIHEFGGCADCEGDVACPTHVARFTEAFRARC